MCIENILFTKTMFFVLQLNKSAHLGYTGSSIYLKKGVLRARIIVREAH